MSEAENGRVGDADQATHEPSQSSLSRPVGECPSRVIAFVAATANSFAWQAGVGGMETAGSIISFLAANPDRIEPFLRGEESPVDWPSLWHTHGCLSWHGMDGKIHSPATPTQGETR